MSVPKLPIDPAMLAAAFSGRKLSSIAGGFVLAVAVNESFPERFSAISVAIAGVSWYIAATLIGVSQWKSAVNAKPDDAPPTT